MYSVSSYGAMIKDRVRMEANVEALRRSIVPGCTVLDIGTGTGVFAILAARMGAGRVFAVESDDVIALAREMVQANGVADRVEFFQGMSTEFQIPQRADVIISDLRGVLPYFQQHIASIVDARERLLAPGGVLMPSKDRIWMSCVESEEIFERVSKPWCERPFGIDMRSASQLQSNQWSRAEFSPEQLLAEPVLLGELEYATIRQADFDARASLRIERDGQAHGLAAWFDTELVDGVGFSNAPGQPGAIYGNAYFPWPDAVPVAKGDVVAARLRGHLSGADYTWTWTGSVLDQGDANAPKATFSQSSFKGSPRTAQSLRRLASSHVPTLGEEGAVDLKILGQLQAGAPLGDIASGLLESFPSRFSSWNEALAHVGGLSSRYCR